MRKLLQDTVVVARTSYSWTPLTTNKVATFKVATWTNLVKFNKKYFDCVVS